MNLSNKEVLAIKILTILKDGGIIKGNVISKEIEISDVYLEQIMTPLKQAGLVEASRGCKGGYKYGCHVANYWHVISAFSTKEWPEEWQPLLDVIRDAAEGMVI